MILKFSLIAGTAAFLFSETNAFTIPTISRANNVATSASLRNDWDNSDFLSSLSQGQEKINEANEKYQMHAQNREAMNEWRQRQAMGSSSYLGSSQNKSSTQLNATSDDGEGGGSGGGPSPEFLRKMGLKGDEDLRQIQQQREQAMQFPPPSMAPPAPMAPPTQMQQPVQPMQQPPQQQFYDQHGNPLPALPMVYDQNGNLVPYYPMPQMQQPGPPQMQQPPPQMQGLVEPPLPPTTRPRQSDSPRPVGYNPDAYTMSNTADVYFAQLKRDSKIRKEAWLKGDKETANKVFEDESVKAIREQWVDNPYTKEKNLEEARREIEGTVRMQVAGDAAPAVSSGISYKEKLQQMKAKKSGQPEVMSTPPVVKAPVEDVMSTPPARPVTPSSPVQAVQAFTPPPMQVIPSQPVQPMQQVQPVQPVQSMQLSQPAPPQPEFDHNNPTTLNEDQIRQKLRTLQGLLIKHRGGPGFGAGRLKAPEAQRLMDTLEEVKDILFEEAGVERMVVTPPITTSSAGNSRPVGEEVGSASPVMPSPPLAPAAPMAQSAPVAPIVAPDPIAGSIACVEAALKMYKESSPTEREAFLLPLREALMSACNACNKVIAEAELSAHKAAMASGQSATTATMLDQPVAEMTESTQPMMGFPTSYAVTKADPSGGESSGGSDFEENSRQLQDLYNTLKTVEGQGKFGLKNISGDEANDLAKKLTAMRGILLDELKS